jgi:hypothetical protein
MAAEIIQLPTRQRKLNSVRSADLYFCWDTRLNNPLLNSLFKQEVCYAERWYLQVTHLLETENNTHPLIQLLLDKQDQTLRLLLDAVEKDRLVQERLSELSSLYSTDYQIKKLLKWQRRWESLINYRSRL